MTADWKVGDVARHKPTGLVGKVKWLPLQQDLPFIYIETTHEKLGPCLRQGEVKEFERIADD